MCSCFIFLSFYIIRLTDLTGLLETVLFAEIRFHDTISRGRLLNRFGKDFEGEFISHRISLFVFLKTGEGIDSSLSDNFGRTVINMLSVCTTIAAVTVVGRLPFLLVTMVLGYIYYNGMHIQKNSFFRTLFSPHIQSPRFTGRHRGTCDDLILLHGRPFIRFMAKQSQVLPSCVPLELAPSFSVICCGMSTQIQTHFSGCECIYSPPILNTQ